MKSLKGHLLVATPELLAPFFTRTVILMFEHSEEGAAGVVLNRPTEATVTDLSEQVFEERFEWAKPIHLGGPVPGPLMVIHTVEGLSDREILGGVYSSIDASHVQQVIRGRTEPSLIVANYAGWGPGQLESEIAEGSWSSAPATAEHVFWAGAEDLWDAVIKQIHAAPPLAGLLGLRNVPEDPTVN
jgi:putative transcriptional regulator